MPLDKEKLLQLYPEYTNVLGPYLRKDGRKHIVLNDSRKPKGTPGKTKTISYPKALVEIREGRRLALGETVDHIDRDKTNDALDNLQILSKSTHAALDVIRVRFSLVSCVQCSKIFYPSREQVAERSLNFAGPFCSRKCSGAYGAKVRKTGEKLQRIPASKEYYQLVKN